MKKKVSASLTDLRRIRLKNLFVMAAVFFLPFLYLLLSVSGLFIADRLNMKNLKENLLFCLSHPFTCYNDKTPAVMGIGVLVYLVFLAYQYVEMNNHLMHGKEYGTARWGTVPGFNGKYEDKKEEKNNRILSENIRFRFDSSTLRNNNTVVVGGSGAGKTSFHVTPNVLVNHDCNVYTDPKGSLLDELGGYLLQQPDTRVYSINMCEMDKSMHINPFVFIHSEEDMDKLISNLMKNTNNENIQASSADPFWEKAEKMFLRSLFMYTWDCTPFYEAGKCYRATMETVLFLLKEAQFLKDKPPALDKRMAELENIQEDHPAVVAYNFYRNGADETVRSVLMTANSRMMPFFNPEVLRIFTDNDIPLNEFGTGVDGDGKTKSNLFIIIPDDDDTFNFVPGMIYTLMFQELYRQARFFHGKLPMDVGFWFDEFANIKMPDSFSKKLNTCRSRGIYCVILIQSLAQIKRLFKDGAWEEITGGCDTFLYLGGNEASTFEYISKMLGKWTIDKKSSGESKGTSGSYSQNYDVVGRELMQEYEVRMVPDDECILFVRGEEPIRDKKWFPWEHEEYQKARDCGYYDYEGALHAIKEKKNKPAACEFLNESSFDYLSAMAKKDKSVRISEVDAFDFIMMDLDALSQKGPAVNDAVIDIDKLNRMQKREDEFQKEERRKAYIEQYEITPLINVFSSEFCSDFRRSLITELIESDVPEKDIKEIVHPDLTDEEAAGKKRLYYKMYGKSEEKEN